MVKMTKSISRDHNVDGSNIIVYVSAFYVLDV